VSSNGSAREGPDDRSGRVGGSQAQGLISYSRKYEDFAQELLAGLQLVGFEPYLDKYDIAAGEDWGARLGRLIEAADAVILVSWDDANGYITWLKRLTGKGITRHPRSNGSTRPELAISDAGRLAMLGDYAWFGKNPVPRRQQLRRNPTPSAFTTCTATPRGGLSSRRPAGRSRERSPGRPKKEKQNLGRVVLFRRSLMSASFCGLHRSLERAACALRC
jgi:hypothetical protein